MRARPSGATVVVAALALTLALAAASLASSARSHDQGGEEEVFRLVASGALRIADSRGNAAILSAPALAPGAAVVGKLTIRNRGAPARLLLSRRHLVEMPGPSGTSLIKALRLKIQDATPGSRKIVYSGPLGSMPTLHLGLLPARSWRRYRFLARLPEPGFVDNGLAGSRLRFDYGWRLKPTRR
jgi:hypothetical protein